MASYKIEIDNIDQNDWDNLLTQFDEATIYQSWCFAARSGKDSNASHIIMKEEERIVGCCQITLKRLPLLPIGIAGIKWGPLCIKTENAFNPDLLLYSIQVIKEEYAVKRGYMLKLEPYAIGEEIEVLRKILEEEGFRRNASRRPYRTFMVDLTLTLEDIRKNFAQKWRNCLNKAEKCGLNIVMGTTNEYYEAYVKLSKEMAARKDLTQANIASYEEYRRIQNDLPDHLKMQIMICEADGEPVSATIFSAVGDTGIYLLGASGDKGLKFNASYLLQWNMIKWLKEKGVRKYDLGAFNPHLNPGVYHFKAGIAGKRAWEETFAGEYFGYFTLSGRISYLLYSYFRYLRHLLKRKR